MAEKGAHLSQTVHTRPSFFDYAAQVSLDNLLYTAVKKVVDTFSSRNSTFQFVSKYFNEVFYCGHFLLQYHYLKNFGGTFSESFYGLKRVSIKNGTSDLTRKDVSMSLLFCSIVPYLREKLNAYNDKIYFDILPYEGLNTKSFLLKMFLLLHNSANISMKIISFIQYLRYMGCKTDVISPSLWAAGMKLDYTQDITSFGDFSLRSPQTLRKCLELTAFFINFCQWWQVEGIGHHSGCPVPPPPEVTQSGILYSHMCPICRSKRKSETVLNVSGFVFCFDCIFNHVKKYNKCPVTNLPASITDLVKLFPLS